MIRIRVPATTANLGPGFDTLGIALNMYNHFIFEQIESGLEIRGAFSYHCDENNLVYRSMLKTFEKTGYRHSGIRITIDSDIPVSRGLGSSAACIVAGVMAAGIMSKADLSQQQVLEIATEIEGHPDNTAPAIFGGLIVSMMQGSDIIYNTVSIASSFKFIAMIPDFTLSTQMARSVLPKQVDHKAAVHNVGRVSLLISALCNGRLDLLSYALQDNLHQPYREKLINNYQDITKRCSEPGCLGSYISGAGPTIMCLRENDHSDFDEEMRQYLATLGDNWILKELDIDHEGAKLL